MQDIVREKLKTIKTERGVTYKFMASKSEVSYTTMKNFMAGRNVSEKILEALNDYANNVLKEG